MPTCTAYVYFGIEGDFDPHEFAAQIPLSPGMCIAKHTRNLELKIPKASFLRYAQLETFAELIDIYELSERSVDILEPHLHSIVSAIRAYNATATFQIVLYFPTSDDVSTPIFGFSERVVSFIASTGASIDIDTYRA